ncbi:extracellular superoxide dismutase [Cu-Zn] [Neosynchiropus ocellatus]
MRPGRVFMLEATLALVGCCHLFAWADHDTSSPPEVAQNNGTLYATCKMRPSSSLGEGLPKVYGQVSFKQDFPEGKLQVHFTLTGFPSDDQTQHRAIHIHQYGHLHQGCGSTGGHYNPHGVDHPLHPGDFGNFLPKRGKIQMMITSNATLFGGRSILGRAVVVHAGEDDLGRGADAGSLLHGNAGPRLSCCVIGIAPPVTWNQ